MPHGEMELQPIELTREISFPGNILFDSNSLQLQGNYADQLSAYRAKRVWKQTLETCFLLDRDQDFVLVMRSDLETGIFTLSCEFVSACARYAFWRLTNHQAPEAQYLIETAHIPQSESHHDDFLSAGDMRSVMECEMERSGVQRLPGRRNPLIIAAKRWLAVLRSIVPYVRNPGRQ